MNNIKIHPTYLSILPLYFVIFFGFIGYSLMLTIFTPMFLLAHNDMLASSSTMATRTILLGILLSLYPLGQFLGSPILGALSDHYGRRKILILSLAGCTIFYIFIALSLQLKSLYLLMLSSFLAGLCEANIVIAQSAIADISQKHDRTRLFGYVYLSASLAYVVGPLFAGRLADSHLVSWFNYATPFWGVFILLILTTIFTMVVFKETKVMLSKEKINYIAAFTSLRHVFINKSVRKLYLVNCLFYVAIYGFFRCYPMYLVDEFHMQVSQISNYIAWVAVPILLSTLWINSLLAKNFKLRNIAIGSAIATGIFMIIIIIPNSKQALWITLFLVGLALAVCLTACATLLSTSVSNEEQGRVMGNNQSLQVFAEALSGIIGGLLAAVVIKLPLIVFGVVAIVGGLVLS